MRDTVIQERNAVDFSSCTPGPNQQREQMSNPNQIHIAVVPVSSLKFQ